MMAGAFIASFLFTEPSPVSEIVWLYGLYPAQLLMLVLGLLSLVARYRSSAGIERQQVKVLVWVAVVALVFFGVSGRIGGIAEPVINSLFTLFVAAALTLAILRYRLFEIDRLISRTVTYAVLAGALVLIYVFGAVWLPSQIVGEQTPLFVAGSTLAVAALFNPLRRRVMRWVDRRFNRSAYDVERVKDAFATRLRDQVDVGRLAEDWAGTVTRTLQPSAVGVWVRDRAVR
jgi:hypothetical protein